MKWHDCRLYLEYIGSTIGGTKLYACKKCGKVYVRKEASEKNG